MQFNNHVKDSVDIWINKYSRYLLFVPSKYHIEYEKLQSEILVCNIFSNNLDKNSILYRSSELFLKKAVSFNNFLTYSTTNLLISYMHLLNLDISIDICTNSINDNFFLSQMEDICYKELINGFNHERLLSILKQSKYFDYLTRGCPNVSEIYYFTHIIFYLSFFNRVRICKLIQTTFEKYDLYEYILTYIIYCLKINNVDLLTELLICSNLICCSLPNEIVELSKEQIFSFLKISLSKKDTVDSFLEAYHTILLLIMLVNCREK